MTETTSTYTELLPEDVHLIVTRLPKDLRELLKKQDRKLFVGGGFIRATIANETPQDIDLFGYDKEWLKGLAKTLKVERSDRGEKATLLNSQNATTLLCPPRLPVQFITRWLYGTAGKIADEFDYTIAQAVVWHDMEWKSLCSHRFYSDLANRRLYYTSPCRNEDAGGSILRALKFMARGYRISPESLGRVIARLCNSVRWDALPSDSKTSDEAALARVLTGLMREVDPLTVIDGGAEVEDGTTQDQAQDDTQ